MKKLIFVHTPKAAGCSIKKVLRPLGERWINRDNINDNPPGPRYFYNRLDFVFGGRHPLADRHIKANPDALSFGVIMDPYVRMQLAYLQFTAGGNEPIEEFLPVLLEAMPNDEEYLGECDKILRLSTLAEDWKLFAIENDLPLELPHVNKSRPKWYKPELSLRLRNLIAERYAWTFKNFPFPRRCCSHQDP